ncbi:MAG TPA: RdgB/HAM1 family non-canonical purine NTP pyrophosphatase [Bryobacteraceae bacterium]|nr:RdgB/HAM1 family non-canonical purine NTP pyrophosphatase [Bryobacteraceae bacterium]
MKVYCATSNPGKLREFQAALDGHVDVEPVPGLRDIEAPPETGATFEANAAEKTLYYSRFCDGIVFADDSGIEVDALGGAPGVYSARYAGPDATDEANNRLVLDRMRGIVNRAARFVCVIAAARGGELLATFRGEVEGVLAEEPRGSGGFGYDPLFHYAPFGCTFGEVPLDRKMQVSHRSRALAKLREWLLTQA